MDIVASGTSKPLAREFPDNVNSFLTFLFKNLVVFFLIYSFSPFSSLPFLTTSRLLVLLLVVLDLFRGGVIVRLNSQSLRSFLLFLLMQVLVTLYCLLLLFLIGKGSGSTLISYSVNFILFFGVGFFVICDLFESAQELMEILVSVTLIQCFVILLCMVSEPFCSFIDSTFNSNSGWDFSQMRSQGYNAGIACITSTGTFQLCLGLIGCLFFLLKGKSSRYYLFSAIYCFITIVMTLVARTGFFLSLLVLFVFAIATFSGKRKRLKTLFLVSWLSILGIVLLATLVLLFTGEFNVIFMRFASLFNGGFEEFFSAYFYSTTTVIPELTWKTFFGTATVSGMSGNGVFVNADGGFVRMYTAIGLPFCVIYYCLFVYLLLKMTFKQKSREALVIDVALFVCLVLLEFKEMHFTAGTFVTLFFVISYHDEELGFCPLDVCSIIKI